MKYIFILYIFYIINIYSTRKNARAHLVREVDVKPATQVQVSSDANLGSYFLKNKITVGASPTVFFFFFEMYPDVAMVLK
jgi:hypothetical protein